MVNINEFVNKFYNHPILFIGSGMSLRYLNNSYNWNDLLRKISIDTTGNSEYFLDLKNEVYNKELKTYDMPELASLIESKLDEVAKEDRDGYFKDINEVYYSTMDKGIYTSRLKIYITKILEELKYNDDKNEELIELKKARKNIGSIITTNYDEFIESIFNFAPLVGNNILLSNPYGSVYKIHGCITEPESIIITRPDYNEFEVKYELIRAQLLSLFIHNPIIFLGYSISDDNIKKILETIFSYVNYDDELSEQIRRNFLLIEYEKNSDNTNVTEHDITIGGISIRINKIKTDNYKTIYKAISDLRLPISAMDIRKVQSIVGDIYRGGKPEDAIKVRITEDLDDLENSDKVLAIGSEKTISYEFRTIPEIMVEYFSILDENNIQILDLVDKHTIQSNQYFPIFAFSEINTGINRSEELKNNQIDKMKYVISKIPQTSKVYNDDIFKIIGDYDLSNTNKFFSIIWNVLEKNIELNEFKKYLLNFDEYVDKIDVDPKKTTDYKRLLCVYDYCKYSNMNFDGRNIYE